MEKIGELLVQNYDLIDSFEMPTTFAESSNKTDESNGSIKFYSIDAKFKNDDPSINTVRKEEDKEDPSKNGGN